MALATDLAQTPAGRPGVAFGPVNAASVVNGLFQQARQAGDAIFDPHGLFIDRPHTTRSRNHFPWLAQTPRPATQAQWERWMQDALDHQHSQALQGPGPPPSFFITASPILEAARGTLELYTVLDAAVAVRSRQPPGTDCWLGVTVDLAYMREEPHLTRLADALLAAANDGVVFRAEHTRLAPCDDPRYLNGFREIVEALAGNGIRVYLPNSGWLGWLATGWGAWGFSGGMAASTWVDRKPSPMNRPDDPANPYFEPQLMRTVRWRVHEELVNQASYQPCLCPDCAQMGTTYDSALAKRHQLRLANQESAALTTSPANQRRARVRARLDQAITFRDGLPDSVKARAGGAFLDRWRQLVR